MEAKEIVLFESAVWRKGDAVTVRIRTTFAVAVAILISNSMGYAQQVVHDARGFECGFIYEKNKGGKSGDASCSYTGERVFSSASHAFPSDKHCETQEVFSYQDIFLKIDLEKGRVVWTRDEGLAPFAVSEMTEYYMRKEKIGREEAAKKAAKRPPLTWTEITYQILQIYKGDAVVTSDPVTKALPKNAISMPVYTIMFGFNIGNDLYSLFVPDYGGVGDAIMSHYVADGTSSWVNLRFGKCRKLN